VTRGHQEPRAQQARPGGRVGVAGVAGIVWYRGKKAAGGTAPAASSDSSGSDGTTVAGGFPNTSGSDAAAILGNNVGALDDALAGFQKSISDIQGQLAGMQPTHPTNGTTPPIPLPKPRPITGGGVITPAPKTRSVPVVAFNSSHPAWNSTLSGIAAHEHTTVPALLKLNPSIKNANVIRTGSSVRVA
jgi:LysM repeat protein